MKTICEQDTWWFSIGANFSHLVWTPDPHICSGKPVSWRRPFWLYVVLFQVFLSALCRYLRILVSWAEFSIWKRSVLPELVFVFPPHMRWPLAWNILSRSWKLVCPSLDCFSYQWHDDPFIIFYFWSRLVEWPTRLPSDSWGSGWLTICLSRRGPGLRRATGYVVVADDTGQRHREMSWGAEKEPVIIWTSSAWTFPKFIAHRVPRVCLLSFEGHNFFDMFKPTGHTRLSVI